MTMTSEAYLITGISILGSVVVWLALYVRKLHNSQMKESKEMQGILVKLVDKNTEAYQGMKASIEMNTVATKNGAEQMRDATHRLSSAVDNLNRDIRNHKGER
jgi:hypothetical protein